MDVDVGRACKQRSELSCVKRLLFGEPVGWLATILNESDLDSPDRSGVLAVQMGGIGVVQAVSVDVQCQ